MYSKHLMYKAQRLHNVLCLHSTICRYALCSTSGFRHYNVRRRTLARCIDLETTRKRWHCGRPCHVGVCCCIMLICANIMYINDHKCTYMVLYVIVGPIHAPINANIWSYTVYIAVCWEIPVIGPDALLASELHCFCLCSAMLCPYLPIISYHGSFMVHSCSKIQKVSMSQ